MDYKFLLIILVAIIGFTFVSCGKEDANVELYPAYKRDGNLKVWGFIDNKGEFAIPPIYKEVADFDENGVAKVYVEDKVGLINESGEKIIPPIYDAISNVGDGIVSAIDGNKYSIIDLKGTILYTTSDYVFVGVSSEEKIPVSKVTEEDEVKMGYIDKKGKVLINPKYQLVYDFKNGGALVQKEEGKYELIDKKGNTIKKINSKIISPSKDNETFIFIDENNLCGYLDKNGDVFIKPKYANAYHYEDGMAIVYDSKTIDKNDKWGVIDNKGKTLIKPMFTSITYLGEGLFAVTKDPIEGSEIFVKKAIFNSDGKQLTDFKYYNVGKVKNKYFSVSDGKYTFFLDLKGKKATKLPRVEGMGELEYLGNVIKANIDDRLAYYDKKGNIIWKEDTTYKLMGKGIVKEKIYLPRVGIRIYYPEIEGLEDKSVEGDINKALYSKFATEPMEGIEDGEVETTLISEYNVKRSNDLLIVQKIANYYMAGAAHNMPIEETYHIDLNTGKIYTLGDLFKEDSNYLDLLSQLVKEQMIQRQEEGKGIYFINEFEGINEKQNFILFKDYIQLYFYPFEVAQFADGFTRFNIYYIDIEDIMNMDSDLWWAYTSTKKGN